MGENVSDWFKKKSATTVHGILSNSLGDIDRESKCIMCTAFSSLIVKEPWALC